MCSEVHPQNGLQCTKTDPDHFAHRTERDKPDQQFKTYPAKDVWVWWEGAFNKVGRTNASG